MKELFVIANERIYSNKNTFFCENKDIQSIVNFLASKYNLFFISRSGNSKKPFQLNNIYKIFNFSYIKIFNFLFFLFNLKKNRKKILIISITPFNFIVFFLFKYFYKCKFYLYLRSDGYEEYESILGKKYVWIYDFMFKYVTKYSEVLSCHKRLYKKKCHILHPSELTGNWNQRIKKNYFSKKIINILYVGRFKVEKGIYSLLNIFYQLPEYINLTLVGNGDYIKIQDERIKVINFINKENELINLYDSSNIIILPSYTEAHPKVIDEALSRMRPVIIFYEIKYVINKRHGVFSVKRNFSELLKKINFIRNQNKFINKILIKNKLPKKIDFLDELYRIVSVN
jgi:glycosyltransferase involved in cell wall biosynthesis